MIMKALTPSARIELISNLKVRFEKNRNRHQGLDWQTVQTRLESDQVIVSGKLWSLMEMERTGGEPDVVGYDPKKDQVVFYDCSPESPSGRRSLCYDQEALDARKENKPSGSALGMASDMGIALLNEAQYRHLQELGTFDAKTSSWIITPPEVRKLGGSLFGDFRYEKVFIYHNGAQSYYAARGFRGCLLF
jgi:hypothetical protein